MLSKFNKNGILTGYLDHYCLFCKILMKDETEMKFHIKNVTHLDNVQNFNVAKYFNFIRPVPMGYYCELCNILLYSLVVLPSHVKTEDHLLNKAYSHMKPNYISIKRVDNFIIAFDDILLTKSAWNAVIENSCCFCNKELTDVNQHYKEQEHILKLIQSVLQVDFHNNIYRKIDHNNFHCVTCNCFLPEKAFLSHFLSYEHKSMHLKCRRAWRSYQNIMLNSDTETFVGTCSEVESILAYNVDTKLVPTTEESQLLTNITETNESISESKHCVNSTELGPPGSKRYKNGVSNAPQSFSSQNDETNEPEILNSKNDKAEPQSLISKNSDNIIISTKSLNDDDSELPSLSLKKNDKNKPQSLENYSVPDLVPRPTNESVPHSHITISKDKKLKKNKKENITELISIDNVPLNQIESEKVTINTKISNKDKKMSEATSSIEAKKEYNISKIFQTNDIIYGQENSYSCLLCHVDIIEGNPRMHINSARHQYLLKLQHNITRIYNNYDNNPDHATGNFVIEDWSDDEIGTNFYETPERVVTSLTIESNKNKSQSEAVNTNAQLNELKKIAKENDIKYVAECDSYCLVCKSKVPNRLSNFTEHVNGAKHKNLKKSVHVLIKDVQISPTMQKSTVAPKQLEKSDLPNVSEMSIYETPEGIVTSLTIESNKNKTLNEAVNTKFIAQLKELQEFAKKNNITYKAGCATSYCRLCKSKVPNHLNNFTGHVNGTNHKKLKKSVVDLKKDIQNSPSMYKSPIAPKELERSDSSNVSETSITETPEKIVTSLTIESNKNKTQNEAVNTNAQLNELKEFAKKNDIKYVAGCDSYCRVCKSKVPNHLRNFTEHVNGANHKNLKKSVVDLKKDTQNSPSMHKSPVASKELERSDSSNVSETSITETPERIVTSLTIESNKNKTQNEAVNTNAQLNELKEFVKKNDIKYVAGCDSYCRVCKAQIPNKLSNLTEHVNGAKHKNLKKTIVDMKKDIQNSPSMQKSPVAPKELEISDLSNVSKTSTLSMKHYKTQPLSKLMYTITTIETKYRNDLVINEKVCIDVTSFCMWQILKDKIICFACNIEFDYDGSLRHIRSKEHLKVMTNSQVVTSFPQEFIREIRKNVFHCGFCNGICDGWDDLQLHLNTEIHQTRKVTFAWYLQEHLYCIGKSVVKSSNMSIDLFIYNIYINNVTQ